MGLIPWSPLARGFLAGNRKPGEGQGGTLRAQTDDYGRSLYYEADYTVVERVAEVAEARGVRPAQVALAWVLSKPGVSAPIIGASKPHHLDDAITSLSIQLSDEEIRRLEEPYAPHPILGHSY